MLWSQLFGLSYFIVGITLFALIFWINNTHNYFKRRRIPYVKPKSFFGNFGEVFSGNTAIYDVFENFRNDPAVRDAPFFGIFTFHRPTLVLNEPDLIKQILLTDFDSFADRFSGAGTHDKLGTNMLFSLRGPTWRNLRPELAPFFDAIKLRRMINAMDIIGNNMNAHVHGQLNSEERVELELKNLASLFTNDIIACCAFGLDENSFNNPDSEFAKASEATLSKSWGRSMQLLTYFLLPIFMRPLRFLIFSRAGTTFIKKRVPRVMKERIKSGAKKHDLIDHLVEMKGVNNKLTDDMLSAQAALFYAAGAETSSSTQSFALYELAKNQEIQKQVRKEIKRVLTQKRGRVYFDAVHDKSVMPCLDQVIQETLRLYPVAAFLNRKCIDRDGYSLEPHSAFKIPYDMPIMIPTSALQRDENYFPNPLTFDPNRFAPENIRNIPAFTNLPFGCGPRRCIGEKFGMIQVKVGIIKILKDFRLEPSANTPSFIIPARRTVLLLSEKPLLVDFVKDPLF